MKEFPVKLNRVQDYYRGHGRNDTSSDTFNQINKTHIRQINRCVNSIQE